MHQILFDGVETGWHNALPLGSGKMGAMVFFEKNTLHIALNHYDCYYQILSRYAQREEQPVSEPGKRYRQLQKITEDARAKGDISRGHYTATMNPPRREKRPLYSGTSHPMAGEALLHLAPCMTGAQTALRLLIEEARVEFSAQKEGKTVTVAVITPKSGDGVLVQCAQSHPGLLVSAELSLPSSRGLDYCETTQGTAAGAVWLRTAFHPWGENPQQYPPFVSETALRLENCEEQNDVLNLGEAGENFCLSASARPGEGSALTECTSLLQQREALLQAHTAAWKSYWHTRVQLPDRFLETLWHLHLYLAECMSGRGGVHFEQACGLNGLWDIRRPSMWGSMWYWDVNIEEAFWHAFSSNHLEQALDFCNGYLAFADKAEAFAQEVYGVSGWAIDYPHALYHCIQPWCAQFLWRYYLYSGDKDFLREKAYPVFRRQIAFIQQIAWQDENGTLHIDPDISPEQGPITRDSVITVSTIRALLQYGLQAAKLLSRPKEEAEEMQQLLNRLPAYSLTLDGSRWKDSYFAPDDLPLRHPSILMPIFPGEEVSRRSPEPQRTLAWNTLRHAAENTELGVFGFGWIAAAAARMGEGGSALRILYEKGLDLCLHSNGMAYEETERWMNFCVITKPPMYWPAMTEPTGGIIQAVNEMLLQCVDGVIEIFPAVPDGRDGLAVPKGCYKHCDEDFAGEYPAWQNCRFERLLAPGGFEVSALRENGKTQWIEITSRIGGKLCLRLPPEFTEPGEGDLLEQNMQPGDVLRLGVQKPWAEPAPAGVQMREAGETHRRVFLGEDRHTAYYKGLDAFVCPYGFANWQRPQWTCMVLDIGDTALAKNYDSAYSRELCRMGQLSLGFGGPRLIGAESWSPNLGWGFGAGENLRIQDRGGPDDLRRDFAEGSEEAEFWLELPKGKYDLLVISGDEEEASLTRLELPQYGTRAGGETCSVGQYQCAVLPVLHSQDGVLRVRISTGENRRWKLNGIIVNKQYGLL